MNTSEIQSCAEMSAGLSEPMLGTAPQVGFWLLLEVRDRWQAKNLKDNELPNIVKEWLEDTVQRAESRGWLPRVQFIRKRNSPNEPISLLTSKDEVLRGQTLHSLEELSNIDVLSDDLPELKGPIYFVCTHGTRDVCCSRFGLETWRQLEKLYPGQVWQTTHLGGHRFAPNVLVLPSGRMYGRLHADEVASFIETTKNGEEAWSFARGNSKLPKQVQACEREILNQGGEFLEITEQGVQFRTKQGIQSVPLPEKRTMQVRTSCVDEFESTVEYYVAP